MVVFHHSRWSKVWDFDEGKKFLLYNSLSLTQFRDEFLKKSAKMFIHRLGEEIKKEVS